MEISILRSLVLAVFLMSTAFDLSHAQEEDSKNQENAEAFSEISFDSGDDVTITADLYLKSDRKETPLIVLCHMAGSSRGEYREIAPKLNDLGFNCLAIDQRSGGDRMEVKNQTTRSAKQADKSMTFVDGEKDILAALDYVRKHYATGKVLVWGSSYSAGLALVIAGEHTDKVDGVLAFSPNEYFSFFGKPGNWVETSAEKIECPAFLTAAKFEAEVLPTFFDAISAESKVKFVPQELGNHGSIALWEQTQGHKEYWEAVTDFLQQFVSVDTGK